MNCETSNKQVTEMLEGSASLSALAVEETLASVQTETTETTTTPPESPSKKKKSKVKNLNDSSASFELQSPEQSPKKASKKKSSSTKSGNNSKSKFEDSASSLNASSSQAQDASTNPHDSPRKSKKSSKEKESKLPHDEDKIITLLTETFWKDDEQSTFNFLKDMHAVLQVDETRNYQKNREVSVQLGAPLLVIQSMNKNPNDVNIQSTALHILRSWGNMSSSSAAAAPWQILVSLGAIERLRDILCAVTDENNQALQDNALSFVEHIVADSTAAKLFVQRKGFVETLKHIVQGRNGTFIPRALEALCKLSEKGGTSARRKVTEEMGEILRDTKHAQLQSAIISLLSEMAADEDTAKGLVQGDGVATLAYVFEAFETERPSISKKAFDLILLLANQGGNVSRRAIGTAKVLEVVAKSMMENPKDEALQKRSCLLVTSMAIDEFTAIKESGVLMAVSEIISTFSSADATNDAVLKAAHRAMDASTASSDKSDKCDKNNESSKV